MADLVQHTHLSAVQVVAAPPAGTGGQLPARGQGLDGIGARHSAEKEPCRH